MLRFLLVLIVFAVAVYLIVRMLQSRGLGPQQARPRRPQKPLPPPRPMGPDDDDDFLRDLDRKRRNPDDPPDA